MKFSPGFQRRGYQESISEQTDQPGFYFYNSSCYIKKQTEKQSALSLIIFNRLGTLLPASLPALSSAALAFLFTLSFGKYASGNDNNDDYENHNKRDKENPAQIACFAGLVGDDRRIRPHV